jgi:hypothetical protein
MKFDDLKKKVDAFAEQKKIPVPVVYAGFGMAGLLVLCMLFGLVASKPAPQGQAPQVKAPAAVPEHLAGQAPAVPKAAEPAPAPAPSVAKAAPMVASAESPVSLANAVIPAQTAPEGLVAHFTGYTMQGRASDVDAWASIATAAVPATLADFSTTPRTEWQDITPTQGRMRVVWEFWTEVPTDGTYTLIVSGHGKARGTAEIRLDDAAEPTLQTAINGGLLVDDRAQGQGVVGLAKGWHKVAVAIEQGVSRIDDLRPLLLKVYLKGPNEAAPVQLTPYAVPPKDDHVATKEGAK